MNSAVKQELLIKARMSNDVARYAICYIDKFADPVQSQWVTSAMGRVFKLGPQHKLRLSCGEPVVVKSSVPLDKAQKIKHVISRLGGICWIQQLDENGRFVERRDKERRSGFDRRSLGRTNAVLDRRSAKRDKRQSYIL